ncbi:hypothetical protein [Mucilaginibacter paludis]|uniref:Uncharacterized protein n=1 Tax=Mucilaginibacter paludis DSM 18603 TaxID=714943 RepID=H1YDF0_9SPHI|nr:hypothetical protein [Mucilaginibacter paludis]EHQ30159.1 hypothetical protein Mucpa_6101 [Mucilaginibacter paludis DSM 18603]
MNIKNDFHQLIDGINDEQLLEAYYKLIQRLVANQSGELWSRLNDAEQQDLLLAYDESFDTAHLLSHELVKKQHEKWLK